MPINIDALAEWLGNLVEEVPTEATFRGQVINIRIGDAPQSRTFVLAGIQNAQAMEALIKRDDVETAPTMGELVTIADQDYKILTVAPLLSLTDPAGYRLTLSLTK